MRSMARRNVTGLALALSLLLRIDQVDHRVEAHPLAVARAARHADGHGQMPFARARSTDQVFQQPARRLQRLA